MNRGEELTVQQAFGEIRRVARQVRCAARRAAVWWVTCGAATIVFWSVMHFADEPYLTIAAVGWIVFSVASVLYACCPGVYERGLYRTARIATVLMMGATVLNLLANGYVRAGGGLGPVAVGVAGVVIAAAPPLYGGWRGLAALRDREDPVVR